VTRLLLDTTLLVDAERDQRRLDAVIADDDEVAIAAITVAELAVGVSLADGRRRQSRQAFLDDVLATMTVVHYDTEVALAHATLLAAARRAGRPRGAHDLIIAATALASGREIVTADPTGFEALPSLVVRAYR